MPSVSTPCAAIGAFSRRPLRRATAGLFAVLALGVLIAALLTPSSVRARAQDPSAPLLGPRDVVDRRTAALRAAFAPGPTNTALSDEVMAEADALLTDLLVWRQLTETDDADWIALAEFLSKRPSWPFAARLRRQAEQAMPEGLAAAEIAEFHQNRDPMTARGARLYGQALAALGEVERGRAMIIAAWRERSMPPAEQQLFEARHGPLLAAHHGARLRMLLWRARLREARRMKPLLSAGDRALLAATTALIRGKRGVDRLVEAVPEALRDEPGLGYARMLWRAKRGRHSDAELLILEATTEDQLGRPAAWADRRMYYAREAYEDARPLDALNLAAGHGLSRGADFAELQWFAGWVALRHLDEPATALEAFAAMWAAVSTPISRARAAYWAGEAASALGDGDAAAEWRRKAAAHPSVFYGQMALQALAAPAPDFAPRAGTTSGAASGAASSAPSPAEWAAINVGEASAAARLLYRLGQRDLARQFIKAMAERAETGAGLKAVAALAADHGDARSAIDVGKSARAKGVDLWASLFPIPEGLAFEGRSVEPALLLAIARQESAFTSAARSGAGALGLMQMMPRTARTTARRAGIPFERRRLTEDPSYNLTLAAAHMDELLTQYRGSYILTAAAYNAGGANVRKWINRFGDPRAPAVDPITWIESIPFDETRNYVQRVLESVQVYRARLGAGSAGMQLTADLTRGAPAP